MRTRLTASYSPFSKILIAIFIFVFVIVILAHIILPVWLTRVFAVFEIILLIASYGFARFITKNRIVIEFDANYFYIVDVASKTEQKFPLENVSWVNLRPGKVEISSQFVPYILHYLDNDQQEQKIKVWVNWLDKPVKEFTHSVEKKNQEFEYKDSTFTFDYKDQ
ncbi:MAG TPA: hypothetical protein VII28_04760 [Puia sp.]